MANRPLSIIICTYNRVDLLRETLGVLRRLEYFEKFEVIVVENTDDPAKRREHLLGCQASFPRAKYLESKIPGLSRARNIGLSAATSDIIAYLDDDASPIEGWAEAVLANFDDPNVLFGGGPIDPRWETSRPLWMPDELLGAFTVLDHGEPDRDLELGQFVYGANMFFRRSALLEIGGFDEQLGRVRNNLHGDEDLAVQKKLIGRGRWVSKARVKHFVPSSRASWPWLVKRFAWQGFTDIQQTGELESHHRQAMMMATKSDRLRNIYHSIMEEPSDEADALERLNFIRAFFGAVYQAKPEALVLKIPKSPPAPRSSGKISLPSLLRVRRRAERKPLFVEWANSHSYLLDAYADIEGAQSIKVDENPWRATSKSLKVLQEIAEFPAGNARPVFLSVDALLFHDQLTAMLRRVGGLCILHRTYREDKVIRNLRALAGTNIIASYSPVVATWAQEITAQECRTIKHPPILFRNTPNRMVGERCEERLRTRMERRLVIALVGEARPGKGFELIATYLAEWARKTGRGERVHVCFSGGGPKGKADEIRSLLDGSGLSHSIELYPRSSTDHRGVSDARFAFHLANADIVLFPYFGDEAASISGHLVDSVFAGARIFVSHESAMASMVREYRLGEIFKIVNQEEFFAALDRELEKTEISSAESDALEQFANEFSMRAVNEQLKSMLEE